MDIFTYASFFVVIGLFLALDLGLFHRHSHAVSNREALIWSLVWVGVAILFGNYLYFQYDKNTALEFFAGYVIEKSLSLDNLFVFVMIFQEFATPIQYQHRVLFWGVVSAIIFRGAIIYAGTYLISHFTWILYILGALLIYTGINIFLHIIKKTVASGAPEWFNWFKNKLPMTSEYHGDRFIVHDSQKKLRLTPLFAVLVLIEISDIIFAVDSIPAVFAITTQPFIVYSSNVLAILGLRNLYFLLANLIHKFYFLKHGLAIIFVFIGFKMLINHFYHVPIELSLSFIFLTLTLAVLLSVKKASSK